MTTPSNVKDCYSPSTQTRTSADTSRTDSKRSRQTPVDTTVTPTLLKNVVDESHSPVEDGLSSEPEDATVKTEVSVSSKTGSRGALTVTAITGERGTPVERGSCAELKSRVKTEVGIAFASKNA